MPVSAKRHCRMNCPSRVAGAERVFERAPVRNAKTGARGLCPGHPSRTAGSPRKQRQAANTQRGEEHQRRVVAGLAHFADEEPHRTENQARGQSQLASGHSQPEGVNYATVRMPEIADGRRTIRSSRQPVIFISAESTTAARAASRAGAGPESGRPASGHGRRCQSPRRRGAARACPKARPSPGKPRNAAPARPARLPATSVSWGGKLTETATLGNVGRKGGGSQRSRGLRCSVLGNQE